MGPAPGHPAGLQHCSQKPSKFNSTARNFSAQAPWDDPVDANAGSPIRPRLADLGQDESGRLAHGYRDRPEILLEFLDATP